MEVDGCRSDRNKRSGTQYPIFKMRKAFAERAGRAIALEMRRFGMSIVAATD